MLGALLEKSQATPEYYPLTLKALVAAANQKTNREPVTGLAENEIAEALERLRRDVLVWRSEGARATRWSESVCRRLGLDDPGRAVLTLLMLRGPQTAGELKARSGRLHPFADLAEVDAALRSLADGEEPLVRELGRLPGQKESRWTHLLLAGAGAAPEVASPPVSEAAPASSPAPADRLTALEERVAALARAVERLAAAVRGERED